MTDEEMQRTMQFIIEQQAQSASNIQKLEESIREMKQSLEASFKEFDLRMGALGKSFRRTFRCSHGDG